MAVLGVLPSQHRAVMTDWSILGCQAGAAVRAARMSDLDIWQGVAVRIWAAWAAAVEAPRATSQGVMVALRGPMWAAGLLVVLALTVRMEHRLPVKAAVAEVVKVPPTVLQAATVGLHQVAAVAQARLTGSTRGRAALVVLDKLAFTFGNVTVDETRQP